METRGTIKQLYPKNGETMLVISVKSSASELEEEYLKLMDEDNLDIKISKHKKKRSLNANSYLWELLEKLSKALKTSKWELYKSYIFDYGDMRRDKNGNYIPITLPANTDIKYINGHWKEIYRTSSTVTYLNFIGSSEYDSTQMSHLIGHVVDDCKEQGIETLTPHELAQMCESWRPVKGIEI